MTPALIHEEGQGDLRLISGQAGDVHLIGQGNHQRESQASSAGSIVFVETGLEHTVVGDLHDHPVGQHVGDDLHPARRMLDGVGARLGNHYLKVERAVL